MFRNLKISKKTIIIGFLMLITLILIVLFLVSRKQKIPSQPIIPSIFNPETKNIQTSNISFQAGLVWPQIPKNLAVYTAIDSSLDLNQLVVELAQEFGLTKNDRLANYWSNADETKYISFRDQNKTLIYTNTNLGKTSAPPNLQETINLVESFVRKIPTLSNFIPEGEATWYKNVYLEYFESSQAEANLVEIPFSQQIDGFPIRLGGDNLPTLRILVNYEQEIIKITIQAKKIDYQDAGLIYPVLSEKEARERLTSGQGSIVEASPSRTIIYYDIQDLPPTEISQVRLEYRYDSQTHQLFPYFAFTGTTRLKTGEEIKVVLILPAIDLPD